MSLCEMCPNTEFFLVRISPHLDWIWTAKSSVFGHFSRSVLREKHFWVKVLNLVFFFIMLKPPRAKFPPMFLSPPNRQRKISHSPIKQHFFENLFPSDKMGWEEKIMLFYYVWSYQNSIRLPEVSAPDGAPAI